jgi:hypothetical protein
MAGVRSLLPSGGAAQAAVEVLACSAAGGAIYVGGMAAARAPELGRLLEMLAGRGAARPK